MKMKKKFTLMLIASCFMVLAACQNVPDSTPLPTATILPTNTPVCTEVPEPTEAPTPTVEPTATSTPAPTATPTVTPTPTEIPHAHSWTKKGTFATCGKEGRSWEECTECGAIQNEVVIPKLEHKKCTYKVITSPTLTEEGKYETTCDECGTVVSSGSVPKLTPTPTPTSTPTPKPTATPKPECKHTDVETVLSDETDKEEMYKVVCENCKEVIETYSVPKATPTPTATPTPVPVVIPVATPVPDHGEIVEQHTDESNGAKWTYYEDGCQEVYWAEWSNLRKVETLIWHKSFYEPDPDKPNFYICVYDETLVKAEQTGTMGELLSYYMYIRYDFTTETWSSRLVNSDGSFNRYSGNIISGRGFCTDMYCKSKKGEMYLAYLSFGHYAGTNVRDLYIYPEEFIYYQDGVIRLYDK